MARVQSGTDSVKVADEFDRFLLGRDIGRKIRTRRFSGKPSDWPHVIDFSGVEQATESCLDELFGTLARSAGVEAVRRVRIEGAAPGIREAIEYVFDLITHPPPETTPDRVADLLRSRRGRKAGARTRPE